MATQETKPNTATPPAPRGERGSRRVIVGTVTSDAMDKTIVVAVTRRVRDRRFHKFLTRREKYKAHDEHNTAKVGDLVEIIEAKPMSRTKRWRLLRTVKAAVIDVGAPSGKAEVAS